MGHAIRSALEAWWAARRVAILRVAVAVMLVLAILKLGDEFARLLWGPAPKGAYDLRFFHLGARSWFEGVPIYAEDMHADYPPASYLMLWPLVGWPDLAAARWLWALTSVAMLAWMVRIVIRESGARARLDRIFVALLLLSMNATGVAIGNGQIILHILPFIVTGVLLLGSREGGWDRDLAAAAFFILALSKPSVSIPFFWLALFVPRRLRPAALIVAGYVLLTLVASAFQSEGVIALFGEWLRRGSLGAALGSQKGGYGNVHTWLALLGLQRFNLIASFALLALLGFWTYRHRRADPWILLGVTAIVARLWTYHRIYDDVLVLLPGVALYRIATERTSRDTVGLGAGVLLGATAFAMLAPARLLLFPHPWDILFRGGHAILWAGALIFLTARAGRAGGALQGGVQ
ncbi:MAG: hypothetical protein A2Y95_09845 [Deltaproteobacteria bacterium RBG_13_65_10]|nr:MAG: hypothetical protein A2Y95_09845 [Deltaproteobacteria bacterium RBG_13_65_10]